MGSHPKICLLLMSLLVSGLHCAEVTTSLPSEKKNVTKGDPVTDHIFVFEGELAEIDCMEVHGKPLEPVLMYRDKPAADPHNYYFGTAERPDRPAGLKVKKVSNHDYLYYYENVKASEAGEYECDWSSEPDEVNHYVVVMKNDTLKCPEIKNPVMLGDKVEGLSCSVTKGGFIRQGWHNNTNLGLNFTMTDKDGKNITVSYTDTDTVLTATLKDAQTFEKEHNGTTLTCTLVSYSKKSIECQSNAIEIQWKPSGVVLEAKDFVKRGDKLAVKCTAEDLGSPVRKLELKVNGAAKESTSEEIEATPDLKEQMTVSCVAGDVTDEKNITIAYGPTKVVANPAKIEATEGDELNFTCKSDAMNPEAPVTYTIDGKAVSDDLKAKAQFHGKSLICQAKNSKTNEEAKASIDLEIKHAPFTTGFDADTIHAEAEKPVDIDCTVSAFPAPTYAWKFTPAAEPEEGEEKKDYSSTKDPKINIASFTPANAGVYECTAKNDLGQKLRKFTVKEGKVEGSNVAAIVVPIIIVLIIIAAVIVALYLMKKKKQEQEEADKSKDPEAGDALVPDENEKKDAPVPTEEDKADVEGKENPKKDEKDTQPENPEAPQESPV